MKSSTRDRLAPEARDLCEAYLRGLAARLPHTLYGLYLHGAAVFRAPWPLGDLDCHAVLTMSPTHVERQQLAELHEELAEDYPPLGGEMDVYYISLSAAQGAEPPHHLLRPEVIDGAWALHRAHMLAGRCIALHGPAPGELLIPPTWDELDAALRHELDYVKHHLAVYPAYCVLNLCRLMYSYEARHVVVSKYEAARWARRAFPDWLPLIEAACRRYAWGDTGRNRHLLAREVTRFFGFSSDRVAGIRVG
jgi:hypothetical protein